jgi:hypothetical protein
MLVARISRRAAGALLIGAVAVTGCGGGTSSNNGGGPHLRGPERTFGAKLPPHYRVAVRLPTVVSHELGTIGYRCAGPRRGLAIGGPVEATEFARFRDASGRVRLAGNVNHSARGPMLRSLRQSLQLVMAVEPGTAVVDLDVAFARAPCEVQQMRVRVDSNQNAPPGSRREVRVDRLGRLALKPHRNIDSNGAH